MESAGERYNLAAPSVALPDVPSGSGVVTWYAWVSPAACWDAAGVHYPKRTTMFAAMRGVACGTTVTISGPAGSVAVPVLDHGPNCLCPERKVDASADAFMAVIGPLSVGVGTASYMVGPSPDGTATP